MRKYITGAREELDEAMGGRKIYLELEPACFTRLTRSNSMMNKFRSAVSGMPNLTVRSFTQEGTGFVADLEKNTKSQYGDQAPNFFVDQLADFAEQKLTQLFGGRHE